MKENDKDMSEKLIAWLSNLYPAICERKLDGFDYFNTSGIFLLKTPICFSNPNPNPILLSFKKSFPNLSSLTVCLFFL